MADARERLKQLAKKPPKGVEVKVPPPRKTPPMPKKVPRARVERAYMTKEDPEIEVRAGATSADEVLEDKVTENSSLKNSSFEHSYIDETVATPGLSIGDPDETAANLPDEKSHSENSTFENSHVESSVDDVRPSNASLSSISSRVENSIVENSPLQPCDDDTVSDNSKNASSIRQMDDKAKNSSNLENFSIDNSTAPVIATLDEPSSQANPQNSSSENSQGTTEMTDFTKDISYVRSLIRKLEPNRHVRDLYEDLYLEAQRTGVSVYVYTTEQLMERCGVARATVQRMRDRAKESPLFECNVSHNKSSSVGRQGTHFQLKMPW